MIDPKTLPRTVTLKQIMEWKPCSDWPEKRIRRVVMDYKSNLTLRRLCRMQSGRMKQEDWLWTACHFLIFTGRWGRSVECIRKFGYSATYRESHAQNLIGMLIGGVRLSNCAWVMVRGILDDQTKKVADFIKYETKPK